jgi:hypothetical protein
MFSVEASAAPVTLARPAAVREVEVEREEEADADATYASARGAALPISAAAAEVAPPPLAALVCEAEVVLGLSFTSALETCWGPPWAPDRGEEDVLGEGSATKRKDEEPHGRKRGPESSCAPASGPPNQGLSLRYMVSVRGALEGEGSLRS